MELIRKIGKFEFIFEPLQKMYVVRKGNKTSFWFNSDEKFELMKANEIDFVKKCKEFLKD